MGRIVTSAMPCKRHTQVSAVSPLPKRNALYAARGKSTSILLSRPDLCHYTASTLLMIWRKERKTVVKLVKSLKTNFLRHVVIPGGWPITRLHHLQTQDAL